MIASAFVLNVQAQSVGDVVTLNDVKCKVVGTNIIDNGSFDEGINGWFTGSWLSAPENMTGYILSETGGFDDGAFITISAGGAGATTNLRGSWAVTEGKTYLFRCYTSGQAPSSNNLQYSKLMASSDGQAEGSELYCLKWGASDVWTENNYVFTASTPYVVFRSSWNSNSSLDGFTLVEVLFDYSIGDDIVALAPTKWEGQTGEYTLLGHTVYERYNSRSIETGDVLTQTITGLKNGIYAVTLELAASFTSDRGFECPTGNGLSVAFANETQENLEVIDRTWVSSFSPITIYATVTDGTLKYGIRNLSDAGNWYVANVTSIKYSKQKGEEPDPTYLVNPDFTDGLNGWTTATTGGGWISSLYGDPKVIEAYAGWGNLDMTDFSLLQDVTLPAGSYKLEAYGFYRYGVNATVDPSISNAQLVAGNFSTPVVTLASVPLDENMKAYADSFSTASAAFGKGYYKNTLDFQVGADNTVVTLGFKGSHTLKRSWFVGGPFTLTRVGDFFEVTEMTLDDPEKWNDLSTYHTLTIKGNLGGKILYSVDRDSEWQPSWPASGEEFTYKLFVTFDVTKPIHTIKLCAVDETGDRTMLTPIEFVDVSYHDLAGIQEKTFTGDSLFQSDLIYDLSDEMYVLKGYQNNVNAGTASFNLEGVFPYSIGRKTYNFIIQPQTLTGEVVLSQTSFVYDGNEFTPSWQFSKDSYAQLIKDQDYTVTWNNNKTPGTGTLTVTGKNNYTGTLSATFNIDKGQLTDELFTLNLPDEDITYDAQSHGATITKSSGVGTATISYQKKGTTRITTTEPTDAGDYTVYLEFAEGTLYYGRERTEVGSFSIYKFSDDEWAVLESLQPKLKNMRWSHPWNLSQGKKSVSSLQGLTIEKGHITELNLSNQNLTGNFPFEVLTLPYLKTLNLSNNYITGNLGAVANCSPVLTTLNASNNCFEDVIPMIPATVTNLNISKQTISRVVPLHLSNYSVETILPTIPTILIYNHTQQTYTPNINLLITTDDNNWGVSLACQNWLLTMLSSSDQNVYYGENGDTLNVAIVNNDGTLEGSTFRMSLSFEEGDGNLDGKVNILDLQTMLNFMFEEYNDKPFNFTASNLCKESPWGRNEQVINVQDAVCLVNKLLEKEPSLGSSEVHAREGVSQSSYQDASLYFEERQLVIHSSIPVSAFDIVVSTNQKCELSSALQENGFMCSIKENRGRVHLIGYSLNGVTLPARAIICSVDEGTIDYAMLSDKDAQEISCSLGGTATIIRGTSIKNHLEEIYRIPLDSRRAIVIDAAGKKTMIKNEK